MTSLACLRKLLDKELSMFFASLLAFFLGMCLVFKIFWAVRSAGWLSLALNFSVFYLIKLAIPFNVCAIVSCLRGMYDFLVF